MKSFGIKALAIGLALATSSAAVAGPTIVLNFDALKSSVNESPLTYYAGGSGSAGTTGGPNYGVIFSSNTLTGCTQPNACANVNSAGNPSGSNVIFFQSGGASTMDVTGGFDTGFSFFYTAPFFSGSVNVWSGLDSTGTLLATLLLPTTANGANTPGCFGTNFCPYVPFGVTFSGFAHSVNFGGSNDQIGFDDITLGSATAGGVPEPATWAMILMGFGLVGFGLRNRRKPAVRVTYV